MMDDVVTIALPSIDPSHVEQSSNLLMAQIRFF